MGAGAKLPSMPFHDRELSSKVIECAIRVHQVLGPGYLESLYEQALCIELGRSAIVHERQKSIPVTYGGEVIGEHRLDLLVESRLIVELKASRDLDAVHFATLRSYLKAMDLESGLLVNFATMPLTVKRVGREWLPKTPTSHPVKTS